MCLPSAWHKLYFAIFLLVLSLQCTLYWTVYYEMGTLFQSLVFWNVYSEWQPTVYFVLNCFSKICKLLFWNYWTAFLKLLNCFSEIIELLVYPVDFTYILCQMSWTLHPTWFLGAACVRQWVEDSNTLLHHLQRFLRCVHPIR
jgi:hypothetical protein